MTMINNDASGFHTKNVLLSPCIRVPRNNKNTQRRNKRISESALPVPSKRRVTTEQPQRPLD